MFLPAEQAAALHTYRELKTDQERAAGDDAVRPVHRMKRLVAGRS